MKLDSAVRVGRSRVRVRLNRPPFDSVRRACRFVLVCLPAAPTLAAGVVAPAGNVMCAVALFECFFYPWHAELLRLQTCFYCFFAL
jgi:hypothetical protein